MRVTENIRWGLMWSAFFVAWSLFLGTLRYLLSDEPLEVSAEQLFILLAFAVGTTLVMGVTVGLLRSFIVRGVAGSSVAGGTIGVIVGGLAMLVADVTDFMLIDLGMKGFAIMLLGLFLIGGCFGGILGWMQHHLFRDT